MTTTGTPTTVALDGNNIQISTWRQSSVSDGPHTPSSVDDGTSTGDDGLKAFIPTAGLAVHRAVLSKPPPETIDSAIEKRAEESARPRGR